MTSSGPIKDKINMLSENRRSISWPKEEGKAEHRGPEGDLVAVGEDVPGDALAVDEDAVGGVVVDEHEADATGAPHG